MTNGVFSEFEVRAQSIKIAGTESYKECNCVGSCEETMNVRTVSKKCRGVVVKEKVKGDGTGTLKLSLHMPYEQYLEAYGMKRENLKEGVYAYGQNSIHKSMSIVQDVYDEDENRKLKAYPNCIIKSGVARKIENGAEEVAEIELEISIMPDENGEGMYEALVSGESGAKTLDATTVGKWMTEFTPELVVEGE